MATAKAGGVGKTRHPARLLPRRGLTYQPRAERSAALGDEGSECTALKGRDKNGASPATSFVGFRAAGNRGTQARLFRPFRAARLPIFPTQPRRCALPWADMFGPFGAKAGPH